MSKPPEQVTRHQAEQIAKDFSKVPRRSKGGQPIPATELNRASRGPNYQTMVSYPQRNGEPRSIGLRNPHGRNYYELHPDGHPHLPNQPHHNYAHYHAVNSKGEKKTIAFGKPLNGTGTPKVKSAGGRLLKSVAKGVSKPLSVVAVGLSLNNVASAEPSDRLSVAANEASSWAGWWAGAAAGAAVGSAIPGVGTAIGAFVGGIVGSVAGDYLVPAPEQQQRQERQQERGGILLSGNADVCSKLKFNLNSIDKIFVDSNGNLIMSSDKRKARVSNCCVKEDDFLLALLIAYRNFEISFSLDPWDPLNPDGPFYQKVFYPNVLENTSIGQTLFECDYIMKKLSFGLLPLPSNVKSTLDHSLNMMSKTPKSSRHRLWIISENIPLCVKTIENNGSALQYLEFGEVKMKCCCKKLNVDPTSPSGLRDANEPENENSPEHLFAKDFSANYGKIAEKYPQFERLRNLSKLVALAKYLRDSGVKINEAAIMSSLSKRGIKVNNFFNTGPLKVNQHEPSDEKVPRLTAYKEKVDGLSKAMVTLTGGIDLGTEINWDKVYSSELPKGITKQFLASVTTNSTTKYSENKSREIITPDGNKATVIPLSVLSPELQMNDILDQGEKMVNNDPPTSLEIAASVIRVNDGNRRAFMLLGNSLSQLSLHRDAVAAFTISAMLSNTQEEYESSNALAEVETAMLLSEMCRLKNVCSWCNSFRIQCPFDWCEVQIEGIDESLTQIYASKPSPYIPYDSSEMLMISEIKEYPDFSILLEAMQNERADTNVLASLYLSLVSQFFAPDSNTKIRSIQIKKDGYRTIIIVYTTEIVCGENYANYHCWLIPDPALKINAALFLLLTCSDMHMLWMDEWAKNIFDESSKYKFVPPKKQNLVIHLRNNQINDQGHAHDDEDSDFKRVLELSKYDF